jgi:hypothetical protein
MVNFTAAAALALRLIEQNGRNVTLFRRNRTPSNASQPWRGPADAPTALSGGASIGPVKVAFVPPAGAGLGKMLSDADGTLLRQADQVGLLATNSVVAAGFTAADVETCDAIRDGVRVWKVVGVMHLQPADTSVMLALVLKS